MPLTQEQFQKARAAGFSTDQIIAFEKKREGGMLQEEQPQQKLKQPFEGILPEKFELIKGLTPEVNPRQMAEDISSVPAHFANQLLYNNPRGIAKKLGYEYPEAEDPTLNVMSKAAGVAGATVGGGGLLKAFGLMKKGQQATTLAQKAAQGGKAVAAGATGGAIYSPEDVTDVGARATQAGFGAAAVPVGFGVKKAGQSIFQSINRATSGAPAFARRVREGFVNKKIESMKKFGADLDKYTEQFPDRSISLSEIMKEAQATSPYDQKLNSFIKGNEQLRKLVDNPELANNMPVKEVQALLNKINPKIQGKYGGDFLEVKDFVHDIKAAQLDAFPEMAQTREMYAKVAEPYRIIKSKIREGALLQNLANKFGDPELNARAESLMTKELKAEVANYRRTKNLLNTFGLGKQDLIRYGIAGGAGFGASRLMGK